MKVRYKYPIKEAKEQQTELAKLFDCVRLSGTIVQLVVSPSKNIGEKNK